LIYLINLLYNASITTSKHKQELIEGNKKMNSLSRFSCTARLIRKVMSGRVGRKEDVKGTWKQRLNLACNMFGKESFPYGVEALQQLSPKATAKPQQTNNIAQMPTNAVVTHIDYSNVYQLELMPITSDKFWPIPSKKAA
jgi:hypothetical protein